MNRTPPQYEDHPSPGGTRSERPRRRLLSLRDYFETAIGSGYLATASRDGTVNMALYDRPVVVADDWLAFAMKERLTHENLQENPYAVYAFHEPSQRYGVRLYLRKVREQTEGDLLAKLRRRAEWLSGPEEAEELKYLVHFEVTKMLPLVVR